MLRVRITCLAALVFSLSVSAQSRNETIARGAEVPAAAAQKGQPADAARRPDRLLQSGHSGSIQALALSADGHWVASGGSDKIIIVWNATTGEQQWKFTGQSDTINVLVFSPDGLHLLSATPNGQVKIWDLQKGTAIYSSKVHAGLRALAFTLDSKMWVLGVPAGTARGTAKVEFHDFGSGKVRQTLSTSWEFVGALTVTPDGLLVASGGTDFDDEQEGSVQVWNVASGQVLKTFPGIANSISANGRFMARIDYTKNPASVIVSDLTTGQQKWVIPAGNPGAAILSGDGSELAITDPMKQELKIWSMANGAEIRTMPAEKTVGELGLNAAAFGGDGKTLAAAPYAGNSIKLWDVVKGDELRRFEGQAMVQGLAATPDGRWLVVSSRLGVNLWDLAAGKKIAHLAPGPVNFPVLSRDGRWLATNPGVQFPGETLRIWDLKTQTPVADFTFGKGGTPVLGMAFVGTGSPLANLGPFSRGWDFKADDGLHTVWSAPAPVASSPDGKLLVAQFGMGGNLDVWDVTSGRKLTTLSAHKMSVSTMSFSDDGRLLVTTGQETALTGNFAGAANRGNEWGMKVWEVATWKRRISISFVRVGAPCAVFSPDGKQVAVEKSWETVEVLDTENGSSQAILSAHDPQPQNHQFTAKNLAFSADGKLVFEGAQNGVRIWKLEPR